MLISRAQFIEELGIELDTKRFIRWKQRAPAPNNKLAFNFPVQYEKDKIDGFMRIDSVTGEDGLVLSYYSTRLLGGFVLKAPTGEIEVHETEIYRSIQLQNSNSGLLLNIISNSGNLLQPTLSQESVALLAGHLIEVARLGYMAQRHINAVN